MGFGLLYCLLLHHMGNVFGQVYYTKVYFEYDERSPVSPARYLPSSCTILEDSVFLPNYKVVELTDWNEVKVEMSPAFKFPETMGQKANTAELEVSSAKIADIYGKTEQNVKDALHAFCPPDKEPNDIPFFDESHVEMINGATQSIIVVSNSTVLHLRIKHET